MITSNLSYILGLFQTDGHRIPSYKERGKDGLYEGCLSLELSSKDADILYWLRRIFGSKATISMRSRITNFSNKKEYHSAGLRIGAKHFPPEILPFIPSGKKSSTVKPPNVEYSKADYWRGIIDGDGSLGFRNEGKYKRSPFISLTTASDDLYLGFKNYIKELTGLEINCNRNKRDNIYNIVVGHKHSQIIINELYYPDCLAIWRKMELATQTAKWSRPIIPINKRFPYTVEEDKIIYENEIWDAFNLLNRSIASIKSRKQKLENKLL